MDEHKLFISFLNALPKAQGISPSPENNFEQCSDTGSEPSLSDPESPKRISNSSLPKLEFYDQAVFPVPEFIKRRHSFSSRKGIRACSNPACKEPGSVFRYIPEDLNKEFPYCSPCKNYLQIHKVQRPEYLIKKPKRKMRLKEVPKCDRKCTKCNTTSTPVWRWLSDILFCNACAQYLSKRTAKTSDEELSPPSPKPLPPSMRTRKLSVMSIDILLN